MKLFKFVLIYIILMSIVMAVLISGLTYVSIDSAITKTNQQTIEREISGIKNEYETFFKANLALLQDYAQNPLFTQAVMQPEINKFIITDTIENIRFFKQQYPMYVLDFEGNIINILPQHNLDFSSKLWIEQLIEDKMKYFKSLIKVKEGYFWQLAVPIEYNNNTEGILVTHIPINSFVTFSNIDKRLSGMSISLKKGEKVIERLGMNKKGEIYSTYLDNNMGELVFEIDNSYVTQEIFELFERLLLIITIAGIITVLISLYLTKKIVIEPLHQLQNGLLSFFNFVNRKTKEVEPLSIHANNEIGDMALIINENILKTKTLLEKERETIVDIAKTVEKFSLGSLDEVSNKSKVQHDDLLFILKTLNTHSQELSQLNSRLQMEIEQAIEENSKKDRLLAEQSKLAAMGEMIGSIAHQWRQPLNTLALKIQFIEDDFEDGIIDSEYLKEYSQESMKLIHFMTKTIDDFRDFFKSDKEMRIIDIQILIQKTLDIIMPQLNNHDIALNVHGDNFKVQVIESEVQQVILNIINNAKDAILQNEINEGMIEVKFVKSKDKGIILITDNGGGIPESILDRIFEPYYTTKEQGKGTGIGLYMSKMIINDHLKGSLRAYNENNHALFEIILPIVDSKSQC